MPKIDIIQDFIEKINNGEKVTTPISDWKQLSKIMKGVDDVEKLINSGVSNFLLEAGTVSCVEELIEQFKIMKIEKDLVDISDLSETNFIEKKFDPDQNVLINLMRGTSVIESLLELIDNSLDAITLSESGESLYEIHLAFIKKLNEQGEFTHRVLIKDNGCGITKEKFEAAARLGKSASTKERKKLIGTWGSGLLISGFKLGEKVTIQTVEEHIGPDPIIPRPVRLYIIDASYYLGGEDPNEIWKVKLEPEEILKKKTGKDLIRERSGRTSIEIEIKKLEEPERNKQINLLFSGKKSDYCLIRDIIVFKLSNKFSYLKRMNKNLQIRISGPGIKDITFNNFSGDEKEIYFDYLDHLSYNPFFPPIIFKNIPIDSTKIEKEVYDSPEEPKLSIKNLIIGLSASKKPEITDDFVKIYSEHKDDKVDRRGLWLWGNGRLFSHEIPYFDDRWPFEQTGASTTILHQMCLYIEIEAENHAGNKLIPWEFPSKRKIEFYSNFKEVLREIIDPIIRDFRRNITKIWVPMLNARLFPKEIIKDDLDDETLKEHIQESFNQTENNPSVSDKYDRSFVKNLEMDLDEFVELFKQLIKKGYLKAKEWEYKEYDEYNKRSSELYQKKEEYYLKIKKYAKSFESDYTYRVGEDGCSMSRIFIRNLKKISEDFEKEFDSAISIDPIKKAEVERKKAEEAEKKAEEERKKAEEAEKKAEEERKKAEEERKKAEDEMKKAEEGRKKAEEAKNLEEIKAREEEARHAEENKKRAEELAKKAEDERKKAEEKKKKAEEKKKKAEEAKKKAEAEKAKAKTIKMEPKDKKMDLIKLEDKIKKFQVKFLGSELKRIKKIIKENDNAVAVITIVREWLSEQPDED